MAPKFKDNVFSSGIECGFALSSVAGARRVVSGIATDIDLGVHLPYDATTTPRKSPKKINRLMSEKSVDTVELQPLNLGEKMIAIPDSPTSTPSRLMKVVSLDISHPGPSNFDGMRFSITDSQTSVYDGDEEFEQLLMMEPGSQSSDYEGDDEFKQLIMEPSSRKLPSNLKVSSQSSLYDGTEEFDRFMMCVDEKDIDRQKESKIESTYTQQNPETDDTPSPVDSAPESSGSSFSSIKTPSLRDVSSFSPIESLRRRKRKNSGPDNHPCSRAKLVHEPVAEKLARKELLHKELDDRQSRPPEDLVTAVAAHTKRSKPDHPLHRPLCDRNYGSPMVPMVAARAISATVVGASANENTMQLEASPFLESPSKSPSKAFSSDVSKTNTVQTKVETGKIMPKAHQVVTAPFETPTKSSLKSHTKRPTSGVSFNSTTTSTIVQSLAETPAKVTPKTPQAITAPTTNCPASPVCVKQTKTVATPKPGGSSPLKETPSSFMPTIIAHDKDKQDLLDCHGIQKGVQYEIARGLTQEWWTWEDITDDVIKELRGSNFAKAGKVAEIIQKGPKQRLSQSTIITRQKIYAELDREQCALVENIGRGLGLMGAYQGEENWHGGRVQLTAKLDFNKDAREGKPPLSIRLNSFGFGKSNRVARFMTSLSILQIKVDNDMLYDKAKLRLVCDALSKPLVICGRQYCVFCAKECKVFFVEVNDDYQRKPMSSFRDHSRISFEKFLRVINPMELNSEQATNKWLARFQLVLSTSQPVLEFKPEHTFLDLDDVYGDGDDAGPKQAETIMTDGCGWINLAAMRKIAAITNSKCPTSVQGRVAGAKGLWLLHPDPQHRTEFEQPMIWLRRSQLKVKLDANINNWDRSLRIFDLVRLPRLTVPSSLYMQTIMNMSENGVEDSAFKNLMEIGLKKEIEPLTKWDGDNACVLLAQAVQEAGGIVASRRAHGAGAEARLYGYVRDEEDEEDDNDEYEADGGLVERDAVSGCPITLYESVRDMLMSGMSPMQSPFVRDKLKKILTNVTKSYMDRFRIPVTLSAEAFIVPDPFGVLEEGQIYFRSSKEIGDPNELLDPHIIQGEVLVTRNPTRVASDVRKVTAVMHDMLLPYTDVIIFSIKGKRSLASYLGGGDYDGDTVTIIAEPTLVNGFQNSEYVPEPPSVREGFEAEVERLSDFLSSVVLFGKEQNGQELFRKILSGLSDSRVGVYSNYHDNAIYSLGYNHPETIRLAYMFTTCLDAVKSGLRIKDDVYRNDSKKWNHARPESMQKADDNTIDSGIPLTRPKYLGPFILDTLKKCGKELTDSALIGYKKLCDMADSSGAVDNDLAFTYHDTKNWAIRMNEKGCSGPFESMGRIERFVESLCEEYVIEAGRINGSKSPLKKGVGLPAAKLKLKNQVNSKYARRFLNGLLDYDLDLPPHTAKDVKASYAHVYGARWAKSKLRREFPFAVAHETLCSIKIRTKGGSSASRECSDYQTISSNLVKSTFH